MLKKYFYLLFAFAFAALLAGCTHDDKENIPTPPAQTPPTQATDDAFLYSVPTEDFANLKLQDFPSVDPNSNWPGTIVRQDRIFFTAHPFVLQYDFNGQLVAYTNQKVVDCAQGIAIIEDSLFIACYEKGIYEIDLKENKLAYHYNTQNGLEDLYNLQLAADGKTLWVGTFNGVAKIDTESRIVRFYEEELGIPGNKFGSKVHARNGEVWATVTANAYSEGGALKYDYESDSWTPYTVGDFKDRDPERRIDFNEFIVSDEGVFASFQDGGPDYMTLKKFDPVKDSWELIYQASWKQFQETTLKDLPPLETYTSFKLNKDENSGFLDVESLDVYYQGEWVNVPINVKKYLDILEVGDNAYYLLSNEGLDVFTVYDEFPENVAKSSNIAYDQGDNLYAKLFVTDDDRYVVFFSPFIDYGIYGITNSGYGIGVHDLETGRFFDGKVEEVRINDTYVQLDTEYVELVYDGSQLWLVFRDVYAWDQPRLAPGKNVIFIIDLKEEKFSVEY